MKIYYKVLLFSVLMVAAVRISAQQANLSQPNTQDSATYPYWIEMMQDPSVNFFNVQRAFNAYWKGREVFKGSGWKTFKRWEYMTGMRVTPTGERPPADRDLKAFLDYPRFKSNSILSNANWSSLGPHQVPVNGPGLGRINAIAFHPTDPNIIWVGAPSGGLWQSVDAGSHWFSNTDGLPTLGVSSIAVDYTNPSILYIGTGDRDAGDAPGVGVMKSTDGGQTWALSNNGMGNRTVGKMLIHPTDPNIIIAATSGGVYKTTDGGQNWVLTSGAANFKDLVFKPGNPNVVYATYSGRLYRSMDAGDSWSQLTNGIAVGGRGVIGVTPANPEYIYFVIVNGAGSYQGTYLSTDGGISFTLKSTTPNLIGTGCTGGNGTQGWYDLAVAVDRNNPAVLYVGGVNIFKSTNAGQTWTISAHWLGNCGVNEVHADQHVFEYSPLNGSLYVGCDGGCYVTANNGVNWSMISQGLTIGQVYKIGQSATQRNLIMNGYQDNGTSCLKDSTWRFVIGGDGMECAIDYTNPLYKYGEVYYGGIDRVYNFTDQGGIAGNGTNGITEDGGWVTPFILHVTDPNSMFIGYKNVWRSNNIKSLSVNSVAWTKISNFGGGNCIAVRQSKANPDILYVVKENHKFYRTDNANAASPVWNDLSSNLPSSSTPSSVEAHYSDANIVYITSNNKVFKSSDKGLNWVDISGTLPDVFISYVVFCKGAQEALYLGTDIGVFYKDNTMTDWIPYSDGLPVYGRITELEIFYDQANPVNNVIKAGSYGRGLWESPLFQSQPIAALTANQTTIPSGCSVNFTDMSSGFPTSWIWLFNGGIPATSTQQNPQGIQYAANGVYDVSLIVSNSMGTDTILMPGFVTVSSTILPAAGFTLSDSVFCIAPSVVTLNDTSKNCPVSRIWSFAPSTVTYLNGTDSTSENPVVQFNIDGNYSVTLSVSNANGTNTLTKSGIIKVGGGLLPFSDDFENGNITGKGWTIENPNNDKTWEIVSTGGNPPGNKSARVFTYGTNSVGRRDRLISPPLDFSGLTNASLWFKHAYAQYQTDYTDSLIVLGSDDCGSTWQRIFQGGDDGTGNFATHPPQTSSFTPAVQDDWCGGSFGSPCIVIPINQYAGKKHIQIAFETYSAMTNNIYIDDVNISSSSGISDHSKLGDLINIYPNPSDGLYTIEWTDGMKVTQVRAYNMLGELVLQQNIISDDHAGSRKISLTGHPQGIYNVEFILSTGAAYKKLILQ